MPSIEGKRAEERSQRLLRVPRDRTPVELVLDDGERRRVLLFVAPGERIENLLESSTTFLPVVHDGVTRFIARTAIACLSLHARYAHDGDGLPYERQRVTVCLRGGAVIRGELRWTPAAHSRRTLDHLNGAEAVLVVHDDLNVHVVAKSAVVTLDEVTC